MYRDIWIETYCGDYFAVRTNTESLLKLIPCTIIKKEGK